MTYVNGFTLPAPDPTEFFQRAINAMWNFGVDMLGRIKGAPKLGSFDHLPRRWRHPQRAEQRLTRTLDWVIALARTLSGDSFYLLPPKRPAASNPRPPGKPRAKPATPKPTEDLTEDQRQQLEQDRDTNRAFGRLRYMRKILATQPTNRIAKRLARRLGAKEGTDWWPEELLTITDTPVAWAARTFRKASDTPATQPADPPPPDPPVNADPAPVAFHRRE